MVPPFEYFVFDFGIGRKKYKSAKMVLLRRWIPSCVRRNSTHGIPSTPTQVHASGSGAAWLRAATKSGHFETSQAFVLGTFWRSPKICWHHPCHNEDVLSLYWRSCHPLFWGELCTILSDIVWLMYHRLISFRVSLESDPTLKSASWITLFMNAVPISQGSQWQNETKLQHSHSTL